LKTFERTEKVLIGRAEPRDSAVALPRVGNESAGARNDDYEIQMKVFKYRHHEKAPASMKVSISAQRTALMSTPSKPYFFGSRVPTRNITRPPAK
jgi:hypothetical protein